MSASTPALTDAPTPDAATTPAKSAVVIDTSSVAGIITIVISSLILFLWHFGAARLSYLKYGSIGWAVLDFIFATIYYPYYALFLAEGSAVPATGIMTGGGRMVKKMMKLFG